MVVVVVEVVIVVVVLVVVVELVFESLRRASVTLSSSIISVRPPKVAPSLLRPEPSRGESVVFVFVGATPVTWL